MTKTFAPLGFAGLALLMLPATTALATTEPSYNLAAIYDADNDNRVSQTEIDAKRTEMHAKFDTDKSGDLSQAEFGELWTSIHTTPLSGEFKEFDKNGNGALELSEWVDPMKQIVAQNDKSGDGFLSREDLRKEVNPMPELLKP
jgi:Ca2+-binding EF-hand superfamily protein